MGWIILAYLAGMGLTLGVYGYCHDRFEEGEGLGGEGIFVMMILCPITLPAFLIYLALRLFFPFEEASNEH